MRALWREHSLTIIRAVIGAACVAPSVLLPEGKGFDLVSGFGVAFVAVALNDALAGHFRETNRPEE